MGLAAEEAELAAEESELAEEGSELAEESIDNERPYTIWMLGSDRSLRPDADMPSAFVVAYGHICKVYKTNKLSGSWLRADIDVIGAPHRMTSVPVISAALQAKEEWSDD